MGFFNSDISKWDVSSVEAMTGTFMGARDFSGDISKWDVSGVTDMSGMFHAAKAFDSDVAKWDVSSVKDTSAMFSGAQSFNFDISDWDVSSVTNMAFMFSRAASFKQKLSGSAWVNSKARKDEMFIDSYGAILNKMSNTNPEQFAPKSQEELKDAVTTYTRCSNS